MTNFLYLENPHDLNEIQQFCNERKAVAYKRCKTKNIKNYWQIAILDKSAKPCGFILTKDGNQRLKVFDFLINFTMGELK
jgi:hypothetical protein